MNDERRGVLVVGHGSRREEANEDVRRVAEKIAKRGNYPLVGAAFLEITSPNISEGFTQLVERGARHITVHPYFLSPGRHTRGDIPVEVRDAAAEHDGVSYTITEPLTAHDLVIRASIERIREADGFGENSAIDAQHNEAKSGTVYIVGAGPGDPGLLTVRARDLLASCDVVVYDYLVNPELLRYAPSYAERVYVGKVGGGRQTPQEDINRILIENALEGKSVVRLKGGDPFIFGRGGEECEALRGAGIAFEVVPGISSALAVPAYSGIPLTHRAVAGSVAIVTGARLAGEDQNESLASVSQADTIVVLMGANRLEEIAGQLMKAGRTPGTPAAVIRWGTYEGQQTVTATLETIADESKNAGMRAPSVIVIGEVVRLRERLRWFEERGAAAVFCEDSELGVLV
ncbi:MAG TPA: uroporphyrinogen-III C-methyltransferase [Pyrinomonadaceae bacterium]|nr:uroporphyrinogen-III C-methyltransferase [Pyrinomonadaceae bacterium]